MIKEYIAYLKDNPQHLWFKRKLYGWGWTPATWQGWLIVGMYILIVIGLAFAINENSSLHEVVLTFILPVVLLTSTLIFTCYKFGEKPKWQWGGFKKEK